MYVALKRDLIVNAKRIARFMHLDSRSMPCRTARLEPVPANHGCKTKTAKLETNVDVHIEGIAKFFSQSTNFIALIADEIV